ncbi:nuclear pore membrane glycoprotein, partial [Cricetulus griseus]
TDHELRCDVKVDVIDSIEIVSRTRELYVDDAPLELMVRALDAKGFRETPARDKCYFVSRILKFSEAEYSPPDYIAEMEKGEQQGDVILVSGMRTGAAVVKVRIYEPFYKKVSAALIRLLVLENIFLIPSHDIYLLVGAYIKYQVAKMVQGRMTGIKKPGPTHCSSVHIAATSPGHTVVTVSVTGHEEHVGSSATFAAYAPLKEISNSPRSAVVELLLVEDVTVQPENATIYNHPDVKEIFHLVEGSGYFLVNSSEQDMVTITYMEAESSVQVEIGKTVLVAVRVLGSSKHPFRNKYFRNMDVRLQLASAIVTLRLMEDQDEYSENYMLRAVTIGQTTLVAIATDRMGRKFTSTPRHIEVFPPFRLVPEKMTLITTNLMQVFLQLPAENNFAMVVHTKVAGRTTIKVTVRSENSSFGHFEGSVMELSDEIQILVFEKLQLFYEGCQPEQILMPMNSQLKLHTNRDDLLLIGPGNRNYTYMAQAVNRGVTVVGLWDQRHPGMADYIPVAVEHAIEPDTKLTFVGDVICFSTHLVNQHGEPGMWMISTNNVIQTDTVTGVGVARSPGTATIFHDIPGVVKTFREVVVNASSRLTLSYDLKTYLTNIPNATVFKLFISTGRNDVNLKGSCTSSQASAVKTVLLPETLLLCHVQFSNTLLDVPASKVFLIRSEFSMERGVYVCLIKVRQKSEELRQILSVADTSVYGWATLVSGRSKNGMQRILIPFIPGFYMNQSELVLSHKDIGDLRVLGVERVLESLEVFSSSPFLAVSGHKHSILTTGMAIYLVRVVNFTAFQMSSPVFINVSCVLTSQHEAVLVRAKDASGSDHCEESGVLKNLVGSYQILLFTLFAVLASTAFIFLAYNAFLNKIQTVPVVYVPTIGTTQPGSYTTCSPPHFLNPQPPLVQSRLQHWLWSIKH